MKKALLISDLTLLKGGDKSDKYCPGFRNFVFRSLYQLSKNIEYELIYLDNGIFPGTDNILRAFTGEGINFADIIKITSDSDIGSYMAGKKGEYDPSASFAILSGAEVLDLKIPDSIKTIKMDPESILSEIPSSGKENSEWIRVVEIAALGIRTAFRERSTNESSVTVKIDLDGSGESKINTGIGFFDHLLSQLSRHSGIDLEIVATGDLHVDEHHTIEDTAITLGEAFYSALGNKRGMERYGFALPMDDCMAQVLVDFGGRPWLVWNAVFTREKIGDMPTEMFMHFFKSFSDGAKCNLSITAEGHNEHHKIEAVFKAMAKAFRMALKRNAFEYSLPTTKGML